MTHASALRALAEHVAAAQDASSGGWPSPVSSRPLAGLGHGAAGMGLAPLEASVTLDDERLVDAATRAFAYERSVFSEDAQNRPDLRGDGDSRSFLAGWCSGAPGIALSRLRALQPALSHPHVGLWRTELTTAAATTADALFGPLDHLCCGNLGRAAVLRAVGGWAREPAWTEAARTISGAVVGRDDDAAGTGCRRRASAQATRPTPPAPSGVRPASPASPAS